MLLWVKMMLAVKKFLKNLVRTLNSRARNAPVHIGVEFALNQNPRLPVKCSAFSGKVFLFAPPQIQLSTFNRISPGYSQLVLSKLMSQTVLVSGFHS